MKHRSLLTVLAVCCLVSWPVDAADGVFDSNGVKIRYVTEGTGEAVVLIHGWMSDSSMWGGDASGNTKLTAVEGFQLIALDCRGHGKSDKPHEPEKYGPEMAADEGKGLGAYIIEVIPDGSPKPVEEFATAIANSLYGAKDVKAFAAAGRGFKNLDVSVEQLAKYKAPILFIHGGNESDHVKKQGCGGTRAARPWRAQDRRGRGPHDHARQAGVRIRDPRVSALRQATIAPVRDGEERTLCLRGSWA